MNSILKIIWNWVFRLTGLDVSFGAKYEKMSFYLIELKANYQVVKKMLAERQITPKETAPGETRLQIIGCDMQKVQMLGSYYEVSFQVPVEPLEDGGGEKFAHLYLPVNSEAARWSGVDICGLPKFIAEIDIETDGSQMMCRLSEQDESILEFRMDDKAGPKTQRTWVFYGNRNRRVLKTTFDYEGFIFENDSKPNASLVLGKHVIANTVREILLSDEIMRTMIGHNISGFLSKPAPVEI